MNRTTSHTTKSSHRRARASFVALVTAGLLAAGAQGAAFAAEEPAAQQRTVAEAPAGTLGGLSFGGVADDVRELIGRVGDLLPDVLPLPKNNNDWK
ncbi:hypothetical protein [Streptomyces sp. NPDC058486]|uniref:hypothetical protein n=1 Tax=unclassified Streptomyces TaxID=2593676 RepID=UPI00364C9AA5